MSELPRGWTTSTIGAWCKNLDSRRIPINSDERKVRLNGKADSELFPYYGATGQVGKIDGYLFDGDYVLIGEDGAPFMDPYKDKAYLVSGRFWVNNHAHILEPYANPKFTCYYLNQFRYADHVTGTTRLKLTKAALEQMPIVVPPLAEQRRIVAKIEELFSELDEGVANLKKARAQLAVYRQALLKHAFEGHLTADWRAQHADQLESADQLLARVREERDQAFERELEQWKEAVAQWDSSEDGDRCPPKPQKLKPVLRDQRPAVPTKVPESWPVFHLDEIVISIGQGWSPKCEGFPAEHGNWGVMKTTAIQPLEFRRHENKQLPKGLHPRPWLQLLENDILITRAGPRSRCGIVCRVKESPLNVMLCDKAYRLRLPESIVSSGYLELLLNSTESSNRIEALKTGINDSGVNITQSGFLNLAFPIPPLSEQMEIQRLLAESLSVIDNIEADIDLNLQKAEALRQSILKKAFAGELVPQDPADEPASELLARIRAEREAQAATAPKKTSRPRKKQP